MDTLIWNEHVIRTSSHSSSADGVRIRSSGRQRRVIRQIWQTESLAELLIDMVEEWQFYPAFSYITNVLEIAGSGSSSGAFHGLVAVNRIFIQHNFEVMIRSPKWHEVEDGNASKDHYYNGSLLFQRQPSLPELINQEHTRQDDLNDLNDLNDSPTTHRRLDTEPDDVASCANDQSNSCHHYHSSVGPEIESQKMRTEYHDAEHYDKVKGDHPLADSEKD